MSEIEKIRIKKLRQLEEMGLDPYPAKVWRSHSSREVRENFEQFMKEKKEVVLCGRLKAIRRHGKSAFAHLVDEGGEIQLYFKEDLLGKKSYQIFSDLVDIGDFVEGRGNLMKTKTGEKTLVLNNFRLISKSLLPLPEKWHGLEDIEIRYRQRYLDLLANPEVKEIFKKRFSIIQTIRQFFIKEGFLEVETPILQPMAGGATAKPFVTHHDALGINLYLSIAPELYLKRLIIGGFEKVFEITRCFRNEGIDWAHNPEFTQIEFYQAYANYQDLMNLTEKLFCYLFEKLAMPFEMNFRGQKINFKPPYPRKKFITAVRESTGLDLEKLKEKEKIYQAAKKIGLSVEKNWSWPKIVDEIFKERVRTKITNPVFIINHPIELSPLAKRTADNPNYVERFQLLVGGFEICNAYSELNNPLDQEERFKYQLSLRKTGDEEAQMYDQDFIEALKYGMPPTAGEGIGLDRLAMILTGTKNLKEVILFPTLKPKN
ncbi:MAG: lysine--tRNA ligase [Patescibacteria group bacterium]|nr:lysine--tRNA ligase [Patescibacteria group bacterium]